MFERIKHYAATCDECATEIVVRKPSKRDAIEELASMGWLIEIDAGYHPRWDTKCDSALCPTCKKWVV